MIDVSRFPLCAKRLSFQNANLSDPAMNAYWAAVAVAEDFKDASLAMYGGFNFGLRTEANGYALLSRLEDFIKSCAMHRKGPANVSRSEAENSVRSFLGANGVKVSMLNGIDDYWRAATELWPGSVSKTGKVDDVLTLRTQIARLPKKGRAKVARQNLHKLPSEWNARAAA